MLYLSLDFVYVSKHDTRKEIKKRPRYLCLPVILAFILGTDITKIAEIVYSLM